MKKIITMILCIMLVLIFASCGQSKIELGEESSVREDTKFDVSMEIVDGTLTQTSATIRVINNTDIEIDSGNAYDFAIESQQNGKWYSIKTEERTNTAEAWTFEGTRDVEINWSQIYGTLPNGHYRIVKYFSPWAEDGTYGFDDSFYLTAEFEIQ